MNPKCTSNIGHPQIVFIKLPLNKNRESSSGYSAAHLAESELTDPSMGPYAATGVGKIIIICGDHPTLASGEVMAEEERKGS